jgi:hypothetical protein
VNAGVFSLCFVDVNECSSNNGGCRTGTRCFNTICGHLCGPFFVTNSLHIALPSESTCTFDVSALNHANTTRTEIELASTQGGERLCVAVKLMDLPLGEAEGLRLRYGLQARPFEFHPVVSNISIAEDSQFAFVEFVSVAGIGRNASLQLLLSNASRWLPLASPPVFSVNPTDTDCTLHQSADLLSYPPPRLVLGSLSLVNVSSLPSSVSLLIRQPDLASAVDHFNDSLVLPNSEAFWVELRGVNLYPRADHMHVHYGPANDLTRFAPFFEPQTEHNSILCECPCVTFLFMLCSLLDE